MESNPIYQPSLAKKNEMLLFGLCSTSDDQLGLSMDLNPIHHLSPAKTMKCSYFDYVHFRWLAGLVNGLEPHPPTFSSQKNEILIFVLRSTSDVGQTGQWTQTPSTTPLQPIKWNAHFWITLNFWWSAGLVNGIEPHLPALFSQKNEMLLFGLCSTSDDQLGLSMDLNPIHHLSPAKKMKCLYFDYVHFRWFAGLVNGLEPHPPPFSSQKNEILIFVLRSTSDVGQTSQWTQTPSTTPLQPIKWNASFWIMFTTDDQPGWSMDSNPICHPSPAKKMKCPYFDYVHLLMTDRAGQWTRKKMKCSSLDYVHFWWSAWLIDELEPHLPPLSYQKNEMLNFQLHSTSDDRPDWLMDSNPICHPSLAKNMKCSFLYYI